jgi:hypothetical protein
MGKVVADFAKGEPTVRPAERSVPLPVPPEEYYRNAGKHLRKMYERFGTL